MSVSERLFQYNQVYYVDTEGQFIANPVAIRPEIYQTRIQWMDTSKGRIVSLGKINNMNTLKIEPPDMIDVISKDGQHYILRKLTLQLYNEKVKSRVMLHPSFNSDDAVQKFYLESDFEII